MLVVFSTISRAIRQARVDRKLSQIQLAKLLGLTQGTISRAESGGDLRLGTLVEIARALDLEPVLVPRRLIPALEAILSGSDGGHSAIYTGGGDEPYAESTDDRQLP
jgi:transcriptional regulator with XRE-family HTH domain